MDDSSQPSSSPASPTFSLQSQQLTPQRLYSNSQIRGQVSPFPVTSTANNNLQPPAGMTYHESIRTWTDFHVACWLSDIKCGNHAATFKTNDIRGDVLLELDQVTLKEMGVTSIGDRLRILNAIKALRHKCSSKSFSLPVNDRTLVRSPDTHSPGGSEDSITTSKSGHERSASEASLGNRLGPRKLDAG